MKIIYTCLFLIGFACFSIGQESVVVQEKNPSNWENNIVFKALFERTETGVEFGYKSMYLLTDDFSMGWGVGFTSYDASSKRSFIPITFELQGLIADTKVQPFYAISTGYSLGLKEDPSFAEESRGGFRMEASLGLQSSAKKVRPYIQIGVHLQKAYYPGEDIYGNIDKNVTYKRLSMACGVKF